MKEGWNKAADVKPEHVGEYLVILSVHSVFGGYYAIGVARAELAHSNTLRWLVHTHSVATVLYWKELPTLGDDWFDYDRGEIRGDADPHGAYVRGSGSNTYHTKRGEAEC